MKQRFSVRTQTSQTSRSTANLSKNWITSRRVSKMYTIYASNTNPVVNITALTQIDNLCTLSRTSADIGHSSNKLSCESTEYQVTHWRLSVLLVREAFRANCARQASVAIFIYHEGSTLEYVWMHAVRLAHMRPFLDLHEPALRLSLRPS